MISGRQPAHSYATLLKELSTIMRNHCMAKGSSIPFDLLSTPNHTQRRALELIARIEVKSEPCSLI